MPNRFRQRMVTGWLVCASCVALLSAAEVRSSASSEQPYRVTRWTTDQGLPQNRISCLKQTRDGYLWLGTWFGLARFDGARFTVFDKFNTPELVNDDINALAEDTDGTLWIATRDGLVSYRDHQFHRLTTADGLPDRMIWRLAACRSGGVWLQAGGFVTHIAGGRFSRALKVPLQPRDLIRSLQEGADGSLHVGTGFDWFTWAAPLADQLANQFTNSTEQLWLAGVPSRHPGSFWVGAQPGLQQWVQTGSKTSDAHSKSPPPEGSGPTNPSPTAESGPTNALLARLPVGRVPSRGVGLGFERTSFEAAGLGQRSVDFIYEDRATNLWVNAKPGGLFREERGHWTAVDLGDSATTVSTTCMEEDREGNLWLGTDQGLIQLQRRRVQAYTTRDGLADDNVWSVCEGTDGTIWVGANRGLSRIQNGRVVSLGAHENLPESADRCVWPARNGGVWIAKSGIAVFEFQVEFKPLVAANILPNPTIHALYEDRSGRLWIGTGNGVAAISDGQITATYTNWAGQSVYDVRCILEDRVGSFWFGTQGQGLARLRDDKVDVFTERDGLSDNNVWAIHETADGALWLGTANGLTRFVPPDALSLGVLTNQSMSGSTLSPLPSPPLRAGERVSGGRERGRFFSFTRKDGLLENAVNWILEDDFGYLWLSGLRGIYRVKREQLNAVAEGRASSVQVAAFGTADGMESNETNGEGQPAGWKSRDGRLWFPTTCGLVVIDPKTVEVGEVPAPVVIEQVKADDEVIFGDGVAADVRRQTMRENGDVRLQTSAATRLAPDRGQVVEISYTANTFADPKRARFRFRLVGRDLDWRDVTTERVAHYTNLRPGDYRFEVIAANHHGVWSPTPAWFEFSLAPHFYETWLFYFLCAAGVVGAAAGVQTYRLRWQRRLLKAEEQRALANERTRIARDLHDDLGTALTGLALQLNVIGREAGDAAPVAARLGDAAQRTRELAERMREVVWTINPACDSVSSLASFLEQQLAQFLNSTEVRVRLDFPEAIPAIPLTAEARHQLALSLREGLANVVKHAHATEVRVRLEISGSQLMVQMTDNGRGFHFGESAGNGLANLKQRLEKLGGRFQCQSEIGSGTTLTFCLPLPDEGLKRGEAS